MSAPEMKAVNGKQPRSFVSELNALDARLISMSSAYEVPQVLTLREWGMEVARCQESQQRELREIEQDLNRLCLEIEHAEVSFKIEQAQRTTHIALYENKQLKREKAQ